MMASLNRFLRRVLALALLLAVPGLIYLGVVAPVRAYHAGLEEEIATLEDTLARYRRLGADRATLAARLRGAEQEEPDAALYLDGASDALAAARLQDIVNGIVKESGGSVESVRVMESADDGNHRRVSVQLLIECRIDSLQKILYAVETGQPYLFIKKIGVANVSGIRSRNAATTPSDLDVQIEIYGYRNGVTS